MKKKLMVAAIGIMLFISGCQIKDSEVLQQEEVKVLALSEVNIPKEDHIEVIKENIFIVEEQEDRREYSTRNKLIRINEDGSSTVIAAEVWDWKLISKNEQDFVYYVDVELLTEQINMGGQIKEYVMGYSDSNQSLKRYNVRTEEVEIVYAIKGEGHIQILHDEVTKKDFAVLETKGYYEGRVKGGAFTLIDLETEQVILEEKRASLSGNYYVHNNKAYYFKLENAFANRDYTQLMNLKGIEALNRFVSCDLLTKEEKVLFKPIDYAPKDRGEFYWEGICGQSLLRKGNIFYLALYIDGEAYWSHGSNGIYQVNGDTSDVKRITEGSGLIDEVFQEGDYLYLLYGSHDPVRHFTVYDLKNNQEYPISSTYVGKDNRYFYFYDYDTGEEAFPWYDSNFKVEIPEKVFSDASKLYRIPVGSIKKEIAHIDGIKKYMDYGRCNTSFILNDYMSYPIEKEGYFSGPSSLITYGLYTQEKEKPFYETKNYITKFEKVVLTHTEKVNLDIKQATLSLKSGEVKKLEYTIDQQDAKLYFISSDPDVATINQEGIVTAHNPGTCSLNVTAIKQGYERAIKNIHITVTGDPKVFLSVQPTVLIIAPGEKVKVQYQAAQGATLEVTTETTDLQIIKSADDYIELTMPKGGQSGITFTATKVGYSENRITIPVVSGKYGLEELITYLTGSWYRIPQQQKKSNEAREMIMSQSDIIGQELGAVIRKPKKGVFTLTSKEYDLVSKRTWNIKQLLNFHMNEIKSIPYREFGNKLKIKLEKVKDKVTIQVSKKELEQIKEGLTQFTIEIKDLGLSIGIPLQYGKELLGEDDKLLIYIIKLEDGFDIRFENDKGEILEKIPYNLDFIVHSSQLDNPLHTVLIRTTNTGEIILGGYYSEAEKGISVGINKGGFIKPAENKVVYRDISDLDEKTQQAINKLGDKGIVNNQADIDSQQFRPNDLITRAEFASMVVKAFYLLDDTLQTSFTDVEKRQWYYGHIACSEEYDLIAGYPDGTFKPNAIITKEQMLAISGRWLRKEKGYLPVESVIAYTNYFKDREDISNWAIEEVAFAVREQLITIPQDTLLCPQQGVKRSEAVLMLSKMLDKLYR